MAKIAILPPALASQIAAGEVVERPSSALKELVENAIDAGATRCDVEISGGGVERLQVRDDGSGMSPEDAVLSLERHATSKLRRLEDLEEISTLGFRGEALPSIASVSRFRLCTRRAEDDSGVELRVEAGICSEPVPLGMPPGTLIEVSDLFFNVPARRKFLRSSGTESGHVTDVLEATALAQPTVTFTLTRDGRKSREWLRAPDRETRVRDVLGEETLAVCRGERGPLGVEAYLGRPERARNGAGGLRLFVNQRPIRDRSLLLTIAQAYGGVLERGRYPLGVVFLELPPRLVDVNAHPQKTEVRFADPRATSDALYDVISRELQGAFSLPKATKGRWTQAAPGTQRPAPYPRADRTAPVLPRDAEPMRTESPADEPTSPLFLGDSLQDVEERYETGAEEAPGLDAAVLTRAQPLPPGRDETPWKELRFLAQVRQTYLLCEGPLGLYVVDQHSASERINFDRLRTEYDTTRVPSQSLLFPVTIETSVEDAALVELRVAEFERVGLEVTRRGERHISVHSVPRLLERASPERLVRDLLLELSRGGHGFEGAVDLALAKMACHGSIRAGDRLNREEAQALLVGLASTRFEGQCPHGRPVVAVTTWTELERRVGRR